MLLWSCPVCGQEATVGHLNLITLFEWYLLATFLFSLAIRYQLYRSYVALFWSMPDRWPNMYNVVKKHSRAFLNWTMTIPVGIMLAIYLIHMLSYRLIWDDADISPPDLWASAEVFLPVIALMAAMFYFDFKGLFQVTPVNFTDLETNLRHGEMALNSNVSKWVRRLTFNHVDPQQIVESRVADTMQWLRTMFVAQLRYQSFHTMVRISFGFLLWTAWVRLKMDLPIAIYLIALLVIAGLIAFAWRWTREQEEAAEQIDTAESPEQSMPDQM